MQLDVTDTAAAERVVRQVIAKSGRIDILVNNAGSAFKGWAVDVPLQDVRQLMEVCAQSPVVRPRCLVTVEQPAAQAFMCRVQVSDSCRFGSQVNFFAVLALTQAVAPHMIQQRSGLIGG
jgi:NADP-dependent 3-hydroxy acid dehydrogenase YdfG